MQHNLRTFLLRQAGLCELSAHVQGCASSRIALIDGAVDVTHPAFQGCLLSKTGDSPSVLAGEHATFGASILVANEADRTSGRVMALCSQCAVLNVAVVTDDMLTGRRSIGDIAAALAAAVDLAVHNGCQIIVFGIEIRHGSSRDWQPLRESLRAARAAGSVAILPAGNRQGVQTGTQCTWPEALIASSCGWEGNASVFSPLSMPGGNTIIAPGENVPGAGADSGYVIRSGTSYAAAIVAGALSLAASLVPGSAILDIAAAICRPPHRTLDGRMLVVKQSAHSEIGGSLCHQ